MRKIMIAILAAASCSVASTAFAETDVPDSPDTGIGVLPAARSVVPILPSFGTGSRLQDEARGRGASFDEPIGRSAGGLETTAYSGFGRQGRSIINWDSRTRAYTTGYPNRAIVYISLNGNHLCTGWLYAPNMVATAGHCVHTGGSTGAWRDRTQMRVFAGYDGSGAGPFGSCGVTRLHSVTGWTQNRNGGFDYGAMRLDCNIGNTVGWFGMYEHTSPLNQPAIIGGYPGDKPRTQWTSADKIRQWSTERLAYRMDTVGGHSGSPIWHDRDEAQATSGSWVFGIHTNGVGPFGTNMNSATRLYGTRIQNFINWRNLP